MVCCHLCHPYCHIEPMHAYSHTAVLFLRSLFWVRIYILNHSDQCKAGSIRKGINKLLLANTAGGDMVVTQLTLSISTSKLRTSKKTWAWPCVRLLRHSLVRN